jgi:uncharacterized membrane protein YbhN (UPF0104 family)
MRQRMSRQYVSAIVVLVAGCGIAWYLHSQRHLLVTLRQVSLATLGYLTAMRLLSLGINGLILRDFASRFEVRLTPKEWFGLSVVTTMGNYITPFSGGMIARAAYLKREHNLAYARFVTLLASNYLVSFWVIGIVGALTLLAGGVTIALHWEVLTFFLAVAGCTTALVVLPTDRLPWEHRWANTINTSLEGWKRLRSDRSLLIRLVLYTILNVLLNGLSLWVAYAGLGSRIPFRSALLVGLLTLFSLLIRMTPGNLGIQEAVVSLSSGLLGMGTGEGLLAALLIRAATLIWAFTLGPVFGLLLTGRVMEGRASVAKSGQDDEG